MTLPVRYDLHRPSPIRGDYEARVILPYLVNRYIQRHAGDLERLQRLLDAMDPTPFDGELYEGPKRDNRARAERHSPPAARRLASGSPPVSRQGSQDLRDQPPGLDTLGDGGDSDTDVGRPRPESRGR